MQQQLAVTLRKSGMTAKSNVALRMSSMHVTTFVACWTPYLVISLWHILDEDSVQKVSPVVQDILFLTAVLNSCINPFVYGGFYVKNFRKQMSDRAQNQQVVINLDTTNHRLTVHRNGTQRRRCSRLSHSGLRRDENIIEEEAEV